MTREAFNRLRKGDRVTLMGAGPCIVTRADSLPHPNKTIVLVRESGRTEIVNVGQCADLTQTYGDWKSTVREA